LKREDLARANTLATLITYLSVDIKNLEDDLCSDVSKAWIRIGVGTGAGSKIPDETYRRVIPPFIEILKRELDRFEKEFDAI